jgi:hypothetical protein
MRENRMNMVQTYVSLHEDNWHTVVP